MSRKSKSELKEYCYFELGSNISHNFITANTAEEAVEKFMALGFNGGIVKEMSDGGFYFEDYTKEDDYTYYLPKSVLNTYKHKCYLYRLINKFKHAGYGARKWIASTFSFLG